MKKLLLLLILATSVFALPQPIGYVNDFAEVIEPEWEEKLNTLIGEIEKNTTVEISIVTVQNLDGQAPEQLALQYLEEWGVGKANDNGLVILVAPQERKYRIEVGYGLEGTIPDSIAGRIGRHELQLYFKQGKYGEGLYSAVTIIGGLASGNPEVVAETQNYVAPMRDWLGAIVFIYIWCLFFFVGFIEIIPNRKARRGVGFTAFTLGILGSILVTPLTLAFALGGFTMFFLVAFLQIEARRPSKLPGHPRVWWGGPGGFGGLGRGAGGFGGFGGGHGGGGGAGGGW